MALTLKYYGQSTFLIEADGIKLVIDPFLAPHNPMTAVTAGEIEADYVLVSHGHWDHMSDAVALAKRTGATLISNFEIAEWMEKAGRGENPRHEYGRRLYFPVRTGEADDCASRLGITGRQQRRQSMWYTFSF